MDLCGAHIDRIIFIRIISKRTVFVFAAVMVVVGSRSATVNAV